MSVLMWNCHSWPLHVSRNVKLPFLTTTCQYQSEIAMLDNQMSVQGVYIWIWTLHLKIWVSVWTSFETGGVYLTAYLRTASENLNSHLILVTSSDNFWGGNSELPWPPDVIAMWNCHSGPLHVSSNVKLPFLTTTWGVMWLPFLTSYISVLQCEIAILDH